MLASELTCYRIIGVDANGQTLQQQTYSVFSTFSKGYVITVLFPYQLDLA